MEKVGKMSKAEHGYGGEARTIKCLRVKPFYVFIKWIHFLYTMHLWTHFVISGAHEKLCKPEVSTFAVEQPRNLVWRKKDEWHNFCFFIGDWAIYCTDKRDT